MRTEYDFNYVKSCINNEGFHYCFTDYSDFIEINDEKFHELRKLYLKAQMELENYVLRKALEEQINDDL